ncbi:MAG: PQQ-binding-like beta-propeller repeat protein [Proteobacteria bacterium]|nr:PQQ-binding-like beta-propeller repeat protein [Pseudomonadota bacterium]
MTRLAQIIGGTLVLGGIIAAGFAYFYWDSAVHYGSMAINYVRYLDAPKGKITTEVASSAKSTASTGASEAPATPASTSEAPTASDTNWPSYNKTLTSDRFSSLADINAKNAHKLKVLCTFDTGEYTGFNSGILEVDGALYFATEYNTFAIDPSTCREKWRAHESYTPATPQGVNRGVAYLDGKIFRGTQDGRVIAYDAKTGKRLWQTSIADPKKGESVPAAPIAWNGLVFVGNAGGDIKGIKGRMYALDATTGAIKWEFYLVPKSKNDPERGPEAASPLTGASWKLPAGQPITGGATWTSYTLDPETGLLYIPGGNPAPDFGLGMREGSDLYTGSVVVLDAKTGAYKTHFKLVPKDWHDWDVSSAPAIIKTAAGKKILAVAPKDGHLYGIDLGTNKELYRLPVTKVDNADAPFTPGKAVHFCPGSTGGAEWNGPAYDRSNNLIMVGEVQWCTTVDLMKKDKIEDVNAGAPWSGENSINPFNTWGQADPTFDWAGWVYAVDADSGQWRWRAKTNYPIQSGMTPTAGGVVFFGDMGGNFYALDAQDGHKLWGQKIGGAIGGGVITYKDRGAQRVAVASGLTEVLWPTELTTAKVSVVGIPDGTS